MKWYLSQSWRAVLPGLSPSPTPQAGSLALPLAGDPLRTSHCACAISWFVGWGYCVTDANTQPSFPFYPSPCTVIVQHHSSYPWTYDPPATTPELWDHRHGCHSFTKCLCEVFYPTEVCFLTIWFSFLPYQLSIVLSSFERSPHSVQKSPLFLPSGTFATLCLHFGK